MEPQLSNADDVYEVERIIKKRRHPSKGVMYFVKWRNFPSSANTWEPACNFSRTLIDHFESSLKNKRRRISGGANTSHIIEEEAMTSSTETTEPDHLMPSCSSPVTSSCSSNSTIILNEQQNSGTRIKRSRGRPKKDPAQLRREQMEIQRNIEEQQHKQIYHIDRKQLAVFNPVGSHTLPVIKKLLTKDPIVITDVTAKDLTVTISECKTPDGFFNI